MPGRNYRRQDGCWNCRRVHAFLPIDDCWHHCCTLGAQPMPVNYKDPDDRDQYDPFWPKERVRAIHKAFDAWEQQTGVEPQSICDNWEAKDAEA